MILLMVQKSGNHHSLWLVSPLFIGFHTSKRWLGMGFLKHQQYHLAVSCDLLGGQSQELDMWLGSPPCIKPCRAFWGVPTTGLDPATFHHHGYDSHVSKLWWPAVLSFRASPARGDRLHWLAAFFLWFTETRKKGIYTRVAECNGVMMHRKQKIAPRKQKVQYRCLDNIKQGCLNEFSLACRQRAGERLEGDK